jgi:formate dehydrogenase iron-sulfur subunit
MSAAPVKSTLIDITKCIGCRACQVACKHWNDRDGEQTELEWNLGLQNPATLSAKTLTLITYHELPNEQAPGAELSFHDARCLHCRSLRVFRPVDYGLGSPAGRSRGYDGTNA